MLKRDYNFEHMLRDWYGSERGRAEIASKLPEPSPIGELLDHAVRKCLSPEKMRILRIRDEWASIAGDVSAKRSEPVFIRDKTLYVEISHPAFRMAMDTPKIKDCILEKINSMFGSEICTGMVFIPAGGRAPRPGGFSSRRA